MAATASRRRNLAIIGALLLAVVIVLILFLLRNCQTRAAVQAPPFDYFVAKAAELGNDPSRILTFVRDQMPTLGYRGNVKGALGSLWNGAASPEEKILLADALLAAAGSNNHTTLDEVSPTRDKKRDNPAPLLLTITHRIEGAPPKATQIYSGPAGALVGDVHSVEHAAGGITRIILRTGAQAPAEIDIRTDAQGESLLFDWDVPGTANSTNLSTVRELWHEGNRTQASSHLKGDRHDFIVIPCAITSYVLEKEPTILKQRGRDTALEASAYLALLNFAFASDALLARIETNVNVTAQRDQPRVLIWSRSKSQDLPEGYASALDARIDRPGFTGDRIAAFRAAQTRSLLQSALAAEFVQHHAAMPARSAFGLFSMLKTKAPDAAFPRIADIRATLISLAEDRSLQTVATFTAQPGEVSTAKPTVDVKWTLDGFTVQSGTLLRDLGAALPAAAQDPPGSRTFTLKDPDAAALAVEACLLAADVSPRIPTTFTLNTRITRAPISPIQPGARLQLQWMDGDARTDQQIRVLQLTDSLKYQWRVQAGVIPVAGTRDVSADALVTATAHNPWYRAGSSSQADSTSLLLSRVVYDAVKAGKNIDLRMLGPLTSKADVAATRPVDFSGALSPTQPTTIDVTINGKLEKITILPATIHGKALAVSDDRAAPLGMAQGLRSIITAIRCRLVDSAGTPITNARISVTSREQPPQTLATSGLTAADGICLLPPPDQSDTYGKATLTVTFPGGASQKVDADLTAPGLSTVTLKADRPSAKLLYLCRNDRRQLDALKLPEETKRHARRDLDAGRLIVIPAQEVFDGLVTSIAYYACDTQTGDITGIMENGIAGAATWETRYSVSSAPDDTADIDASALTASSFRPNWSAWNAIEKSRQPSLANAFERETLLALRSWADATDVAGAFAQTADAALVERLVATLRSPALAVSGNAAKPAFQIGYISTTNYLARATEAPNGK
jgi:hypothetical protein